MAQACFGPFDLCVAGLPDSRVTKEYWGDPEASSNFVQARLVQSPELMHCSRRHWLLVLLVVSSDFDRSGLILGYDLRETFNIPLIKMKVILNGEKSCLVPAYEIL